MSSPAELKQEQRYAIRNYVRRGLSDTEALNEMTVAYGQNRLGKSTIRRWHKSFSEGRAHCTS